MKLIAGNTWQHPKLYRAILVAVVFAAAAVIEHKLSSADIKFALLGDVGLMFSRFVWETIRGHVDAVYLDGNTYIIKRGSKIIAVPSDDIATMEQAGRGEHASIVMTFKKPTALGTRIRYSDESDELHQRDDLSDDVARKIRGEVRRNRA